MNLVFRPVEAQVYLPVRLLVQRLGGDLVASPGTVPVLQVKRQHHAINF
jgi:hypothetical protein